MSALLRTLIISTAVFSGLTMTTTAISANEVTAEEASRRVNVAGRQRMLSQRMAMSACFVTAGIDTEMHYDQLETAFAEFSQVHDGLRNGDEELDLHAEGFHHVIDALAAVEEDWVVYEEMIAGFIQIKMMTPGLLNQFDEHGLAVLEDMNIAVASIAHGYSADLEELPQILALTIDFAGRQRMLTQKVAKEFCLVTSGVNVEENLELLLHTQEQFDLTMVALEHGIPHMITAAPTAEILERLYEVDVLWKHSDEIISQVIAGEEITREDRHFVSSHINEVLHAMEEAVKLYETVHGLPNF